MKKWVGIFIMASILQGSETRISTLGQNREILIDEANGIYYPTQLSFFPQIAVLELGPPGSSAYFLGTFKIGKYGILGTYIHRKDEIFSQLPVEISSPPPGIDIIYTGIFKNKGIGLGIGFANYFHSEGSRELKSKEKIELTTFRAGFIHLFKERKGIFEIGINLIYPYYLSESANDTTIFTEPNVEDIRFRIFFPLEENIRFINFLRTQISNKGYFESGQKYFNNGFSIQGGIGTEYRIAHMHQIVASYEGYFSSENLKYDQLREKTKVYSFMLLSLGIESSPLKWLYIRAGIRKYEKISSSSQDSSEEERTFSGLEWAAGIGIKFNRFRIDGRINPDLFYYGPYVIGGVSKVGFLSLTLSYSFGSE